MKKVMSLVTAVLLGISVSFVSFSNVKAEEERKSSYLPKFEKSIDMKSGNVDYERVMKFFNDNKVDLGIENPQDMFSLKNVKKDKLGYTHIKLQQTIDGIPVFGNEYIVHFNTKGQIYTSNGKVDKNASSKVLGNDKIEKLNKDFIPESTAVEIAKQGVNAGELQHKEEIELFMYEVEGNYVPVYKVRLNFLDPEPGDWHVFVNAYDGTIVNKYNGILFANTQGTGVGILGDEKTFNVTYEGGQYKLIDDTNNGTRIITYDANNRTFFPEFFLPGSLVTDNDNVFDGDRHKAAVDAHHYAKCVYDYYKDTFGRDSIDGNGMDIKSSVHFKKNYVNAFWNGYQMVYGDGDGVEAVAICGALDVVAHEMTHGVTSHEANLTYQNQSGALNESFSDVFGTIVEFKYQPEKADYLCGEDVWTPNVSGDALRSLENPTLYNQPDHMNNYVNTSQDNGGVHINSGIPNKAAYLIMDGIGVDKTAEIYYRALTIYLTSSSNFSDARAALLQSAEDLYGRNGQEYNSVSSAFDSVGIY